MRLVSRTEAAFPAHDHGGDEWLSNTLMQAIDDREWESLDDGWFDLTSATVSHIARFIRHRRIPVD